MSSNTLLESDDMQEGDHQDYISSMERLINEKEYRLDLVIVFFDLLHRILTRSGLTLFWKVLLKHTISLQIF